MHNRQMFYIGFFLVGCAFAVPASAQSIPQQVWDLIDGSEDMKELHRDVVIEVLSTAHSYGDCEDTILRCLINNPNDKIAKRLANFAARRVKADKDPEEIAEGIEQRRLSAFPPKVFEPHLEGLPVSGSPKAPVKVVVYADFGCPLCSVASPALRRLSQEEPDLLAFYFKNYPLKSNPEAVPAALALLAAGRQGKFWEMHDLLYEKDKDELCDETYESCAETIGLDLDQFRTDMKNPDLIKRLRAEKTEGIMCGVERTPGLLFNGKPYLGVKSPMELLDRIEEEIDLLDPTQ